MNRHEEIRLRLAAYCGGDLEPGERRLVELHLDECPVCRAELADLETALRLVRTTPEVDPPPWLTARVMARVREQQSAKRGWLERFFLPMHIKLPLEAMALVMVCVTGWYISRTVQTELTPPVPQINGTIPSSSTALPQPVMGEKREGSPPAARPEEKSILQPPAMKAAEQPATRPAQSQPAAPPAYAPPPPASREERSTPASGSGTEPARMAPAPDSVERHREAASDKRQDAAKGALRNQTESLAPAPAGSTSGKLSVQALPQTAVRLSMNDPSAAPDAIREALIRSGGGISDESELQRNRIRARIPTARIDELLQRLERLGRIIERPAAPAGVRDLEITVQW
jgi:hypothetical protein